MLYNVAKRNVTSSGSISSKKITLSANAKAFRLLFDRIYPDIKKAIVRELFTNGWDSQKTAGTLSAPIEIHIPTKWEPFYSVRDYGTGMLPHVVDDVYSRIFESTKDLTNDEAGMFGMGSKTPLGYGDSFSVTSYVDSVFWYYDIYMDTDGSPVIDLKATGETDEPNGVLVQLAVHESDFDVFKSHAEHFALGANTPVSINREKFLRKVEILKEGPGWQLLKKGDDYSSGNTQIRMGPVLYTLNMSYVRANMTSMHYNEKDEFISLLSRPFVLDFDIGTFDVTGSREDIIYNAEVVKKIRDRLYEAVDVIRGEAAEDIRNAKSYYHAFKKYHEYAAMHFAPRNAHYGAMRLERSVLTPSRTNGLKIYYNPVRKKRMTRKPEPTELNIGTLYSDHIVRNYIIVQQVDTEVKKLASRIENFISSVEKNIQFNGNYSYGNRRFNLWYVTYEKETDLKRLHVFLPPNAIIVKAEDLELVVKKRAPKLSTSDECKFLIKNKWNLSISKYETIELEDDSWYVKAEYSTLEDPETMIQSAIDFFKIDLTTDQIRVIGKGQRWLLNTKYKMKDLVAEFAKEKEKIRFNKDTMNRAVLQRLKQERGENIHYYALSNAPTFAGNYLTDFAFDEEKCESNFNSIINDGVIQELEDRTAEAKKIIDDFMAEYPILKYVHGTDLSENFDDVMNTIKEMCK